MGAGFLPIDDFLSEFPEGVVGGLGFRFGGFVGFNLGEVGKAVDHVVVDALGEHEELVAQFDDEVGALAVVAA